MPKNNIVYQSLIEQFNRAGDDGKANVLQALYLVAAEDGHPEPENLVQELIGEQDVSDRLRQMNRLPARTHDYC